MSKVFVLVLFTAMLFQGVISGQTDTAKTKSADTEEFSFKAPGLVGLGGWVGAYSGSGAAVRFSPFTQSKIAVQINGFFFMNSETSFGCLGLVGLLPFKTYEHSRYLAAIGASYYSDLDAKTRFGVSVVGEWEIWNRLVLNLALDALTLYNDGTFQVPLVSGGLFVYF